MSGLCPALLPTCSKRVTVVDFSSLGCLGPVWVVLGAVLSTASDLVCHRFLFPRIFENMQLSSILSPSGLRGGDMFQDVPSLKTASRNLLLLPLLLLLFTPAAPAATVPSTPLGLHILPLAFGFRGCSCFNLPFFSFRKLLSFRLFLCVPQFQVHNFKIFHISQYYH